MTALDLLTAMQSMPLSGENSFNEAIQVTSGHDDEYKHRRLLEGLGHIRTDWKSRRVHVIAPRLILLPCEQRDECEAVLVGARNPVLLDELKSWAEIKNLNFSQKEIGEGFPERITLKGSFKDLKIATHECRSFPLEIADDPMTPDAWRLLCSVVPLQSIIQNLRGKTTGIGEGEPAPSAEVFNPDTGFTAPWRTLNENYASRYIIWYKKSGYDYRLFWQRAGDLGAAGGWLQWLSPLELETLWYRWAVMQAAEGREIPSIALDGVYRVPRLTPLPTELHRVCCLCSGFPPEEKNGFYEYRGVPPVIQEGVNERLMVDNP
jgi:hypothetical protein